MTTGTGTAWVDQEICASRVITAANELFAFQKVEAVISGASLIGPGPIEILKLAHRQSRLMQLEYSIHDFLEILKGLRTANLQPCRIDIALLTSQWVMCERPSDIRAFFLNTLGRRFITPLPRNLPPLPVVLFGFGRIARALTRILARYGPSSPIIIKAVIIRSGEKDSLSRRAYLLGNDTVYGSFPGDIEKNESGEILIVNGNEIRFIAADKLENVDLTPLNLQNALMIDTTGEGGKELEQFAQVNKNILFCVATYPFKGIPEIIHGANQFRVHEIEKKVFSTGSDSAAAILPVLRLLHDEFSITDLHIENIRSYTNDQNLLDNIHSTARMGRAAPGNLVLTGDDLSGEIIEILPEFAGMVTTGMLRAPILNGSLAIVNFSSQMKPGRNELNEFLKAQSLKGDLRTQLEYSEAEDFVSSDITSNPHCALIDSPRTQAYSGHAVVYLWYDNEYGYACQIIRMLQEVANISIMQYG